MTVFDATATAAIRNLHRIELILAPQVVSHVVGVPLPRVKYRHIRELLLETRQANLVRRIRLQVHILQGW